MGSLAERQAPTAPNDDTFAPGITPRSQPEYVGAMADVLAPGVLLWRMGGLASAGPWFTSGDRVARWNGERVELFDAATGTPAGSFAHTTLWIVMASAAPRVARNRPLSIADLEGTNLVTLEGDRPLAI